MQLAATLSRPGPSSSSLPPAACACPQAVLASTGGTDDASAQPPLPAGVAVSDPELLDFVKETAAMARVAASDRGHCFTVFDSVKQTRLVRRRLPQDLATRVGIASSLFAHFGSPPSLRVLQVRIIGLPSPQIAATPSAVSGYTRTWPLDARALGLGICVVDGPLQSSPFSLAYKAKDTCRFAHLHQGLARRSLEASVIYFDLRAAYYRMLRQILVPIQEPEEGFMRLLHSLQLPDDALRELVGHLQSLSVLELAEVTPC